MIRTEALTKRFGRLTAVDGLTFSVAPGEIFGLLGPNGAGKTTTIRMLTTLARITSGMAWVAGRDVAREPLAVKRRIGVAPQGLNLEVELTAEENLEFHGRLHRMPRAERRRRISEILDFVGLAGKAGVPVDEFSGGMKRRLLIARALMHRPRVLFLDEPTVGLDPQIRRRIWALIQEMRSAGLTVLVTTHYIEEADALCNRVGILRRGRLIAMDTPGGLKRRAGEFAVEAREGDGPVRFFATRDQALAHARALSNDVVIRRTNLEDVFLGLTGEKIHD